jgi:hypothetical protein
MKMKGQQMRQWVRPVLGVVLLVTGALWSVQGSGAMGHGGGMSGHSQWLVIGLIVAVAGVALLGGAVARMLRGGRA